MNLLYILAALVMLGVMVMVHEAGHFFAARLTGIPVKEFTIGFGPKLHSWKSKKHDTVFSLRAILAGGACIFYGEDDAKGKEAKTDPRAIGNYAVWRRVVTIFTGPLMNFFLALLVAILLFGMVGEDTQGYYEYPVVSSVEADSPAAEAGFQVSDRVISVNGEDAKGPNEAGDALKITSLINAYRPEGEPLVIEALRGEETVSLTVRPRYSEKEGRYLMGVGLNTGYVPGYTPVSLPRAAALGFRYCVQAGGAILGGLKDLITTGKGIEESAGPVGIVKLIVEETQKSAAESFLEAVITYGELLVLISVNLGLFNLLPIPGLDGSRIVFLVIEAIRRKPVPQKVEAWVHLSGYMFLLCLLLVMTFKDVVSIFR